jgi:hypothetical protein
MLRGVFGAAAMQACRSVTVSRRFLSAFCYFCVFHASDIHPLYGQRKHYPILMLRGVFGATAMQVCR